MLFICLNILKKLKIFRNKIHEEEISLIFVIIHKIIIAAMLLYIVKKKCWMKYMEQVYLVPLQRNMVQ